MKKKIPTEKTSGVKQQDEPSKETETNDDELPSLSHLDLEDALKKAMEVPWSGSDNND